MCTVGQLCFLALYFNWRAVASDTDQADSEVGDDRSLLLLVVWLGDLGATTIVLTFLIRCHFAANSMAKSPAGKCPFCLGEVAFNRARFELAFFGGDTAAAPVRLDEFEEARA